LRNLTRLALFGLLLIATTRSCGRPRFARSVDKRSAAA
jgi:hypothetical protein